MKKTKKAFKEVLNNWYYGFRHKQGAYHQRVRLYGDYLYSQDRVLFDLYFNKWAVTDTRSQFEAKE